MQRLLVLLTLMIVLAGCATTGDVVGQRAWEPAQLERMMLAAKQANDRGDKAEAERFCVSALQYVAVSTVNKLQEYATLLKTLKREGAEVVQAKVDKLRQVTSQPGGGYLGFQPSDELNLYADLLQELGRGTEAEAMRTLATADDRAKVVQFMRQQERARGGDPRGKC